MLTISPSERVAIAEKIGIHEQYLYQCLTGRRALAPERCPGVELASGGVLRVDALRPDVRWVRVRDKKWPHPDGRPLIDAAQPA